MKRNRLFSRENTLMIAAVVLLFAVLGCGLLPTSGGEPEIEFAARKDQIERGECTVLEWDVQSVEGYLVFLDGEEVHASGRQEVCPKETTSYNLVVGAPGGPHEERVTISVVARSGPAPTRTPVRPSAAPTTGPVVVFRDDFNGALGGGWSWVREDPTHWNLADAPGSLRIILQPEGVSAANNLLLRSAPGGKFEIATLVRFTPTSNYQFAGLLIYQDDSNFVQFGRAFCGTSGTGATCVGNGIYLDNIRFNKGVEPNYATATASQSQAHLRLRREGNTYTAYYSEDGANWTVIGQHTNGLTPSRVGLVAAQAYQAETTADFDFFTVTTLP